MDNNKRTFNSPAESDKQKVVKLDCSQQSNVSNDVSRESHRSNSSNRSHSSSHLNNEPHYSTGLNSTHHYESSSDSHDDEIEEEQFRKAFGMTRQQTFLRYGNKPPTPNRGTVFTKADYLNKLSRFEYKENQRMNRSRENEQAIEIANLKRQVEAQKKINKHLSSSQATLTSPINPEDPLRDRQTPTSSINLAYGQLTVNDDEMDNKDFMNDDIAINHGEWNEQNQEMSEAELNRQRATGATRRYANVYRGLTHGAFSAETLSAQTPSNNQTTPIRAPVDPLIPATIPEIIVQENLQLNVPEQTNQLFAPPQVINSVHPVGVERNEEPIERFVTAPPVVYVPCRQDELFFTVRPRDYPNSVIDSQMMDWFRESMIETLDANNIGETAITFKASNGLIKVEANNIMTAGVVREFIEDYDWETWGIPSLVNVSSDDNNIAPYVEARTPTRSITYQHIVEHFRNRRNIDTRAWRYLHTINREDNRSILFVVDPQFILLLLADRNRELSRFIASAAGGNTLIRVPLNVRMMFERQNNQGMINNQHNNHNNLNLNLLHFKELMKRDQSTTSKRPAELQQHESLLFARLMNAELVKCKHRDSNKIFVIKICSKRIESELK